MAEKISFSSTESQEKSRDRRQWETWSTRTKGITILTIILVVLFVITLPIILLRKSNLIFVMEDKPQLVVIMLSGMRWDYIERLPTDRLGGFNQFKKNGVRVEHVNTVFPSLKMPAWTTLQTGLYPEDHNVLGNRMLDQTSGMKFEWEDETVSKLPFWWQYAEPVWVTISNQGKRVATLEWSSADVPYKGQLPEIAKGYTKSNMSFMKRIQEVKQRLMEGFDMIMMYYEGVDAKAQEFGPDSNEVMREIVKVGQGFEDLFDFVKEHNRLNYTNILVVSDRGHADTCNVLPERGMDMFFKIQPDDVVVMQDDAMYLMYTSPDHEANLISRLQGISGYEVHRLEDLPAEFHYKRGLYAPRVVSFPSPIAQMDSWSIPTSLSDQARNRSDEEESINPSQDQIIPSPSASQNAGSASCLISGGVCGLDPLRSPEMRTMFLGWGDAFAGRGLVHPPLHLVDVYQLFFHTLDLPAPTTRGNNWNAVRGMLRTCALAAKEKKGEKNSKQETSIGKEKPEAENTTLENNPQMMKVNEMDCEFDVEKYLVLRQEATIQWESRFIAERNIWQFDEDINLL